MYVKLKQIKRTWLTRFDSPFALILLLPVFVNIFQTITEYVCQCLVRDYVIMLGGRWGRSLMHKELCLLKKETVVKIKAFMYKVNKPLGHPIYKVMCRA